MRVAFIVDSCVGCLPTFILSQIEGLIDLGIDVHIFCEYSPKDEKIERRNWNLGSKSHYFPNIPYNKFKRILKAGSLITKVIYKDPITTLRTLNIFRYGKDSLTLKNLFYTIPFIGKKYDILHCHYGPVGLEYIVLKDILRVKYLVAIHGFDITKFVKQEGKDIYAPLFKSEIVFMPISLGWMNRLVELGCDRKKIIVHHMGVDIQKFKLRGKKINQSQYIKILTVARLSEEKGLEYSIQAIARVVDKHPNVRYQIIGDGPLRERLMTMISEMGLDENVKILGWADNKKVAEFMQEADIFLLSSIGSKEGKEEGIPVALIEAQASRLPVISTIYGCISEIVEDGKSGFLVPPEDVNALTEKLNYLIEHPEIWSIMGRAGRKIVEEKFDIKKLSKKLVKIYNELCSRKL